jgi:lysophospholipase L1-like esterase
MLLSCDSYVDNKMIIAGDSMAYHLCADDYMFGRVCENVAVNGSLIQDVKKQLYSIKEDEDDVLVVWSGINNFFRCKGDDCVDEILVLYSELLDEYATHYEKIILVELLPTIATFEDGSVEVVPMINSRLRLIVDEYENVVLLRHNEALLNIDGSLNETMTTDGLHLNENGNDLVWSELRKLIY